MEGFVTKRGHLITNWKVRWFILEKGEIRYYKDRAEQNMKGRYILRSDSILSFHSDMGLNKNIILIFTTTHPFRKKALYFSCDSPESKEVWFQALTKSIDALKSGVEPPSHTAPSTSMPLPAYVLASAAETMANVFTSASDKQAAEDTAMLTAMTNNSNLERGRTRNRPNTGERNQSPVRAERSRSVDLSDRRGGPAKPIKVVAGAAKRLKPATSLPQVEVETNNYTAADYDSSDTDGSMVDERQSKGNGRGKSGSDAPARVRPLSTGASASSASNGHSAAAAAEAANTPLKPSRRASTNSTPTTKPASVVTDDLPNVAELAAEEGIHHNKNISNAKSSSNSSSRSEGPSGPGATHGDGPIKPPKSSSSSAKKPACAEEPTTPVSPAPSSPTEFDNPWIEVSMHSTCVTASYLWKF